MKTKIFLSIIFGVILFVFFTQFNFYSKTYISITTDHFVSEYKLTLTDPQQNIQTLSQKPPADYPFFYIFDENYTNTYHSLIGYFTAYFPLSTEMAFQYLKLSVISSSPIDIKNICIHNAFKEKCWNAQEIPQSFNIYSNTECCSTPNSQQLTLEYKDDFQTLHQAFLVPNFSKKVIVFLLIFFLSFLYFQRKKIVSFLYQNKPEIIFLWLGSIFGILTCFINPPFQVPDELYHLSHAFYLTQYPETKLFPTNAIISAAELHLHYRHTPHLSEEKLHYFSQLPLHLQTTLPTIYNQHYSMFPYVISAIGIYIGKILELSWLDITYLARITNFLVWLVCSYIAIRLIPIGKWLLCLLALSPMSVFQAASISIDGLANGLSFLLTALILKFVLQQSPHNKIFFFSIFIISILLVLVKFPYIILLSLILLFFTQRSLKFSHFLISIFSTSILLGSFLWFFFSSNTSTNVVYQLIYNIIHQPIDFIKLIIETIKLNGMSFVQGWVGIFGWLEIKLPNWFIALHLIMLCLYAITDFSTYIFNKSSNALILMIFLVGILAVFTALYIIETPYLKLSYIDGIQGRYFIPLGILPFLLLQNKQFSFSNNTLSLLSVIYIPFSLIFMLISIYKYYH